MHRILAIIERDLRRFRRSPTLIVVSIIMPLVQLVVLGYAFGGKLKNLEVGVVNQDQGMSSVKLQEMFQAVAANARTFNTIPYSDQAVALHDLRTGRINAVLNIPPYFSRGVLAGDNPKIALVEDNSDQFVASALEGTLSGLLIPFNQKSPQPPRLSSDATLSVVEVYPYVPYIQYLLPGSTVLAIFVSAMTVGAIIAGIPDPLNPARFLRMLFLVTLTALALISMMFLIMVRVSDPLVPRAIFGVLNTLLYFPSGAVYPIAAFPGWMRALATVDPFTYAVHGFKELMLKNSTLWAIAPDIAFLTIFTIITMAAATALFRRTL
jgi:ABC-2 type transport system permease protein